MSGKIYLPKKIDFQLISFRFEPKPMSFFEKDTLYLYFKIAP
jgi:hypothetical protein